MILRLPLVIDVLSESGVRVTASEFDVIREYASIELFIGQPIEDDVLYVLDCMPGDDEDGPCSIICGRTGSAEAVSVEDALRWPDACSDQVPEALPAQPFLKAANASSAQVINCITRYIAKAGACLDAIRASYYGDGDLQGVCQTLSDFVGNPVLAYDNTLLPIAQTEFPREYALNVFGEDRLGVDYVLKTIADWNWEPHVDTITHDGAILVWSPDGSVVTSMCNVFWDGELQGRLEIFQLHKAITSTDIFMLEQTCKIASVSHPFSDEGVLLGQLLGQHSGSSQIENWFTSMRWRPDDGVYVLAIGLPEAYKGGKNQLNHIMRSLRGYLPYSVAVQMDDTPVIVSNDRLLPRDKALDNLLPFLVSVGPEARLGSSEVMLGIEDLHVGYTHAQFAARMAKGASAEKRIVRFEECRFAFFSDVCNLDENKRLILDEQVARMYADDVQTGSENVLTAKTYIESGFNLSATAEALSIHRNTAAYRLKHMSDRYGIDLSSPIDNPNTLFQILLSCKLLLEDA